mmetsp:Transcript_21845/g.30547  ORF Transcript_21845/g.30547 Transcript_21845/m.30547 type:complete len:212 (+) Transcript_21845:202-837(+)
MFSVPSVGKTSSPELYSRAHEKKSALQQTIQFENHWTFWFDRYPGPGLTLEEYQAALVKLGTVNTVQDFWKWFNNLPPIHRLEQRTGYHIMKKGILPLWEDSSNINGGHLSVRFKKEYADLVWTRLALAVVGEQFSWILDDSDDVCGITISTRKTECLIAIWNSNAKTIDLKKLQRQLSLQIPHIDWIEPVYKVHAEEVAKFNQSNTSPKK